MTLSKFIRNVQQIFEAIPAPAALVYNAAVTKILGEPERKIAKDIVEKMESGIILDLGSGTGYLPIEVANRAPNLKVFGVDLSRQMIKIARRHAEGVENAQFEFGNAANLPFEDDSIDFIVSTGSLHHWAKPAKVFDECYRVLKIGKEAWIYDGCPDAVQEDIVRIKKKYGVMRYRILVKIAELHGFFKDEYENKIGGILEQTKFKNSFKMELTDNWMKITLKK